MILQSLLQVRLVNTVAVTYMQNCVKDYANLRVVIQATEVFEDIHVLERIPQDNC